MENAPLRDTYEYESTEAEIASAMKRAQVRLLTEFSRKPAAAALRSGIFVSWVLVVYFGAVTAVRGRSQLALSGLALMLCFFGWQLLFRRDWMRRIVTSERVA